VGKKVNGKKNLSEVETTKEKMWTSGLADVVEKPPEVETESMVRSS